MRPVLRTCTGVHVTAQPRDPPTETCEQPALIVKDEEQVWPAYSPDDMRRIG
jgi:hypothetical protein